MAINITRSQLEKEQNYYSSITNGIHAGVVGKYIIEKLVRIPVDMEIASSLDLKAAN